MKKVIACCICIITIFASISINSYNANTVAYAKVEEPIATPEPTEIIINRIDYLREHPEEVKTTNYSDAQAMARVADAVCPKWTSAECKAAVMCCVYNRSKTTGFPDTITEVANQPYQWEGLTADSVASEETTQLARELLEEWQGVCTLPINRNCVFMTKNYDGIWFRSSWDGNNEVFVPYV